MIGDKRTRASRGRRFGWAAAMETRCPASHLKATGTKLPGHDVSSELRPSAGRIRHGPRLSGYCLLADCRGVESETRFLFWAKVLREYRGGPKSLDVHALEAIPGILRVAEASFGWNLAVQVLLFFLMVAPAWGAYEVALTYIPNLGTSSAPLAPQGVVLFFGVFIAAAVIVGLNAFGSRRNFGRFILAGAFDHAR